MGPQILSGYACDERIFLLKYTHQNPLGPNHPRAANMAPGTAGIPSEHTSKAQSLRPNEILRFNTTIKNATKIEAFISEMQYRIVMAKRILEPTI